jgi:predicted DNA-binding transcriptional regulator YafY
MRQVIYRAMHQSDDLVVTFDYCDARGILTHRVVSPIRFLGKDRFLALCLSREEPRQFYLERCRNVRLAPAGEFLMPVELTG